MRTVQGPPYNSTISRLYLLHFPYWCDSIYVTDSTINSFDFFTCLINFTEVLLPGLISQILNLKIMILSAAMLKWLLWQPLERKQSMKYLLVCTSFIGLWNKILHADWPIQRDYCLRKVTQESTSISSSKIFSWPK